MDLWGWCTVWALLGVRAVVMCLSAAVSEEYRQLTSQDERLSALHPGTSAGPAPASSPGARDAPGPALRRRQQRELREQQQKRVEDVLKNWDIDYFNSREFKHQLTILQVCNSHAFELVMKVKQLFDATWRVQTQGSRRRDVSQLDAAIERTQELAAEAKKLDRVSAGANVIHNTLNQLGIMYHTWSAFVTNGVDGSGTAKHADDLDPFEDPPPSDNDEYEYEENALAAAVGTRVVRPRGEAKADRELVDKIAIVADLAQSMLNRALDSDDLAACVKIRRWKMALEQMANADGASKQAQDVARTQLKLQTHPDVMRYIPAILDGNASDALAVLRLAVHGAGAEEGKKLIA